MEPCNKLLDVAGVQFSLDGSESSGQVVAWKAKIITVRLSKG